MTRPRARNAVYELQRRERDLIHLGAALVVWVAARLAVLLGAAVDRTPPCSPVTAALYDVGQLLAVGFAQQKRAGFA